MLPFKNIMVPSGSKTVFINNPIGIITQSQFNPLCKSKLQLEEEIMDPALYGGSNLENSALERALRRRRNKDCEVKPRERPLLTRANAVRREDEVDALRSAEVSDPIPATAVVISSARKSITNKGDGGKVGTPALTSLQKTPGLNEKTSNNTKDGNKLPLHVDTTDLVDSGDKDGHSPLTPNYFPYSPFDSSSPNGFGDMSNENSPRSDQSPSRDSASRQNSLGQPLLDSEEVSYFLHL
jgi:hypothetical protein